MTRKRTVADAVLRIPAAMAEAAFDELPGETRSAMTATQAANVLQLCSTAARGIAFILENPQSRVIAEADKARVENPPEVPQRDIESPTQQDQAQRERLGGRGHG